MKKNKKSQLSIYIAFIILSLILVTITAILAPMGILFTTEMYQAGEDILADANESLQGIDNATIRNTIGDIVDEAGQATETNIEVLGDMYQYAWIVVLVVVSVVVFLLARAIVEYNTGGRLV